MAAINQSSWRDRAIERSECITDAWEVTKTYAGRLAEWILFACMVGCIIEILPGVAMWGWLSNTILGVQAVTLDIGGFALSSMADQARSNGDEQAARKADTTGKFLIGIVILTLTLITIGLLYAPAKQYTDGAEKVLILVRVMMTVVYGHVIHSLRRKTALMVQPGQVQTVDYEQIANQLLPLVVAPIQQANSDVLRELRGEMAKMEERFVNLQAPKSETAEEPVSIDETEEPTGLHLVPSVSSDVPVVPPTSETEIETTKATPTASERAARILKRHRNLTAAELAKRAQITPQYAGKLLKKQANG